MLENNPREEQADIDEIFIDRWSPRSFQKNFKISDESIRALMGAARWAPSCYNDQPWRFVIAKREDKNFSKFLDLLVDMNREWAQHASAIGFIFAKRVSDKTGDKNPMAEFDCGAAWMSLTMQARMDGLYTHGMGGIKHEDTYSALNVPKDDFKIVCAFAVGKKGDPSNLPEDLEEREEYRGRKDIDDIYYHGNFKTIH